MPFLRRRRNISESNMRRHTSVFDALTVPKPPFSRAESASDLACLSNSASRDAPPLPTPTPPVTPPAERASIVLSFAPSTSSTVHDALERRPSLTPMQEETSKMRRFSILRFRNASDSQLAAKAKMQAAQEKPPPLPPPPDIITTAPTFDGTILNKKSARWRLGARLRISGELPRIPQHDGPGFQNLAKKERRKTLLYPKKKSKSSLDTPRPRTSHDPPPYGDHAATLTLPPHRLSESSRSDASSGEGVYGSTTTTTHTVHTTTTFFRLPRRRPKTSEPLFPIAHLQQHNKQAVPADLKASNQSVAGPQAAPLPESVRPSALENDYSSQETPTPSRPSSRAAASSQQSPAMALFRKSNSPAKMLFRSDSKHSAHSSPTFRARSSTMSSLGKNSPRPSVDGYLGKTSTRTGATIGRKSFGDLLGLSRLRQNSELIFNGSVTPLTPGSSTSKHNSLHLTRDSVVLPERREDDTPAKYLERLLDVISRSVIAAAVSKGTDAFSQSVLRSYMRSFMFFEDPMDMAIRKLLMEAELPKETQQIDRCLQAFANRYHECNPGVFANPDQAYFIAFSLLILHTDVFNKNNKHKMQKTDYLKNTGGEGIFDEILEVYYDNITYTPFIHVEDDLDINGERIIAHKAKRTRVFVGGAHDAAKRAAKEPIDPYTLILDRRLDILRPNLKDVMPAIETYSYKGTATDLNLKDLQKTFFKTGVLQIVSARSRPDAFMSEKTAENPQEAHPGIVDIKITKVGLLWRKDVKKKKTRSPWQEWGVILTGAQLYFFRNTTWVKSLVHQYEEHVRKGHDGDPCIFKPPLDQFKPDALMSTDRAVALMDKTYKKHKHAFMYVRHGGLEEVLLAEDEAEMNDWLAKLNYAAAFRTSGVRMRGVVGGQYDGQGRRAIRRLDSGNAQFYQTPTGEVTVTRSRVDLKMAQDILAARRDIMLQKVAQANEKIAQETKNLDVQERNARHLQILAPIQPKTREQMLLSAARLSARVRWTLLEIWKLTCHRDILLMDLEDERQQLGLPLPAEYSHPATTPSGKQTAKDDSTPGQVPMSAGVRGGSRSLVQTPSSIARSPILTARKKDPDSPVSDVFTAPSSSAARVGHGRHRSHTSWELPSLSFDCSDIEPDLAKASVASAVSSSRSMAATPPQNITSEPHMSSPDNIDDGEDADDYGGERDLLAKAGLIGVEGICPDIDIAVSAAVESAEDVAPPHHRAHLHGSHGTQAPSDRGIDQGDRGKKARRSLQRTLRESAGSLSHHRSRKGKDALVGGSSIGPENVARGIAEPGDAVILDRGAGSFTVHGKKASVISFGTELSSVPADENIRQRKTLSQTPRLPLELREESGLVLLAGAYNGGNSATEGPSDFVALLEPTGLLVRTRSRRESGASGSTTTIMNFRELYRNYSSARRDGLDVHVPPMGPGTTSLAGTLLDEDQDSDAESALSFMLDARPRSPLRPTTEVSEGLSPGKEIEQESEDDEKGDEGKGIANAHGLVVSPPLASPKKADGQPTRFFPPEPPSSPAPPITGNSKKTGQDVGIEDSYLDSAVSETERLPSPPLQSVRA